MRNPQFVGKPGARLGIEKTYKLYIGGNSSEARAAGWQRRSEATEAFRRITAVRPRKDSRDAGTAARSAFAGWSKESAYLRGQILYRAAESLVRRDSELRSDIERTPGRRLGAEPGLGVELKTAWHPIGL